MKCVPRGFNVIENEFDLFKLRGLITCDKPNMHLYDFKGKLLDQDDKE